MGREKGRRKNYLYSFQVIVLGLNIAAITQECTLLSEYLLDQRNSKWVVMQKVSHWSNLTRWEFAAASSVFSLPHPQKTCEDPSGGGTGLKMCLRT